MEEILDQPFSQPARTNVKYGGFWQRFGALIVDGIIFSPITVGVTYFNVTSWKSPMLMAIISIIGIAYKPLMENLYGATWGKMLLKLKVTNLEYERATLGQILLRNIFNIIPNAITMLLTMAIYFDPDFEYITGFMEFTRYTQQYTGIQLVNNLTGLFTLIDAIVLGVDSQKRSIHDRIAGTLVLDES